MTDAEELVWHRVTDVDALADGRVMTVTAGRVSLALTRFTDRYGALDNHCPHQGGPLGKGNLQGCIVTCPWHGWQFDVTNGEFQLRKTLVQPMLPLRIVGDEVQVEIE